MNSLRRETLAKHPVPPTTPLEALVHVLAVYEELPDDRVVIDATRNIYPKAPWTGLRLGDLRSLLRDHAHELAEKQRAALAANPGLLEHELIDLIDPKKEGQ